MQLTFATNCSVDCLGYYSATGAMEHLELKVSGNGVGISTRDASWRQYKHESIDIAFNKSLSASGKCELSGGAGSVTREISINLAERKSYFCLYLSLVL